MIKKYKKDYWKTRRDLLIRSCNKCKNADEFLNLLRRIAHNGNMIALKEFTNVINNMKGGMN